MVLSAYTRFLCFVLSIFLCFSVEGFSHTNFTLVQGDPLEIGLLDKSDVSCNGGSDGFISIEVSGGIEPYVINWSNGAIDILTISNLMAGTYTVTVTDGIGDNTTESFVINEPDAITVVVSNLSVITCANPQANISVFSNGGTGAFSYSWSNGASGASINVGTSGVYIVTATDINGCTASLNVTVVQDIIAPNISAGSDLSILCSGSNVVLQGSGPTGGNFTIQWTTVGGNIVSGGNTYTPTVSAGGSYTLIVTDNSNGCSATDVTIVTGPPSPISLSLAVTNLTCHDSNNGQIVASVSGGAGNFSYAWSNGGNGATIANLTPGNYSLTVTDQNGCTATTSAAVTAPTPVTVTVTTTDQTQFNVNDGSATANPSGGTGAYTYIWNTGGTTSSIFNLAPGGYTVTVTDANGCTSEAFGVVEEIVCTLSAEISVLSPIFCNGINSGALGVQLNGGVAPFSYVWSTGSDQTQINNLFSGEYSVTITDAVGCTAESAISIDEPPMLVVNLNVQQISSFGADDGSITATPMGGTPGYSFIWSNGSNSPNISNLTPGLYTVTVTDTNGCVRISSAVINEFDCDIDVTIASQGSVLCFGDESVTLSTQVSGASGTITYSWSNGSNTANLNNIGVGTYSVTVTDDLGCFAIAEFSVTGPTQLNATLNIAQMTGFGANDGSISASVSGGVQPYSYSWSNGAVSNAINNLGPGTYFLTITDGNGCQITTSGTIQEILCDLSVEIVTLSGISCFNGNTGSLTAQVTGSSAPQSYAWSNGSTSPTISSLTAGTYSVTVIDMIGCTSTATITLNAPSQININLTINGISGEGEEDGSILANVSGGIGPYSYTWSNGMSGNTINNLSPGLYTVTVTDTNGCVRTATGVINNFNCNLDVSILVEQEILCFGLANGAITAEVQGGEAPYQYLWSNDATGESLSEIGAGTYSVTVTDSNNCATEAEISLDQPTAISAEIEVVQVSSPNLNDGSISINISGGTGSYTILWSNGSEGTSIENLTPGNYSVTITDSNGCVFVESISLPAFPCNIQLVVNQVLPVSCFGGSDGSVIAQVTGSDGPFELFVLGFDDLVSFPVGNYVLTAIDQLGCEENVQFEISQPSAILVESDYSELIMEEGSGFIHVDVFGGAGNYTLNWFFNDEPLIVIQDPYTLTDLNSGSYRLVITDENDCVFVLFFEIFLHVSTREYLKDSNFSISPNPVNNELNISLVSKSNTQGIILIGISDTKGVQHFNLQVNRQEETHSIGVAHLSPGFYLLSVTTEQGRTVKPFVKY